MDAESLGDLSDANLEDVISLRNKRNNVIIWPTDQDVNIDSFKNAGQANQYCFQCYFQLLAIQN